MPIYVYQCSRCDVRTEVFQRTLNGTRQAACGACGSAEVERVITPFAIYRSEITKLEQLDPKYRRRVDAAIANTPEADPMRHLQRMTPFDSATERGDPIRF
jgi:putative FmdB family regulatory protein